VARLYGVDILASRKNGTLAIGFTNDVARAIQRDNPDWDDLYEGSNGQALGSRQQVPGRQPWLWQGCASPA
jgi:hypothetical protein